MLGQIGWAKSTCCLPMYSIGCVQDWDKNLNILRPNTKRQSAKSIFILNLVCVGVLNLRSLWICIRVLLPLLLFLKGKIIIIINYFIIFSTDASYKFRVERINQNDNLDRKLGFERYVGAEARIGYLLNVQSVCKHIQMNSFLHYSQKCSAKIDELLQLSTIIFSKRMDRILRYLSILMIAVIVDI
jgi:hypothetical protein